MTRVLVVDDDRSLASEFETLLRDAGCDVRLAADGRHALEAIRHDAPDVVLTDLEMPVMDGLELVQTIRREFPGLPVILMTAMGVETAACEALQQGATSYVRKQNLAREVVRTIGSVLAVAQSLPQEQRLLNCLEVEQLTFVLENDVGLVTPLLRYLEQAASLLHPGDRHERMRVGIAVNEALMNAIQHGNLELDSELRQDDERIFYELGEQRRHEDPYRNRRVRVRATLSRTEAVYVIEDEGPGFDPRTAPDPKDPANIQRIGGRGLMLIRMFMDAVEFNPTGNQITLRKNYKFGIPSGCHTRIQ